MRKIAVCNLILAIPLTGFLATPSAPDGTNAPEQPAVTAPLPFHPHFRKKIEVRLPGDVKITVSYITATFDAEGAKNMKPGGSWHLGNAHIETTADLTIGGVKVPKGKHSIKARKTEKAWELAVDAPGRYRVKVSDEGKALATKHNPDAALFEHLSIDIHPSGDKSSTKMYLDVRFDKHLARTEIVLPKPQPRRR